MYKRKIYAKMLEWNHNSDGRNALLIEGARRIGFKLFISAASVEVQKRDILKLYEDDFMKLDSTGRISMLFNAITAQLNKNVSRYRTSSVFGGRMTDKICPIEVKSSGYKTHKSLDMFTEKFSGRILWRYLLYTKDLAKEKDIFCVPVYMTQFLCLVITSCE
jgi:hypothetical protein